MKTILVFLSICILPFLTIAQTKKVAILDFENLTGNSEFDALGKALSEMLITDLKNNIHPKKVEFFERTQLNKLIKEQKLQKSKNFDSKTAVSFGKLSGVDYVFLGSVIVLNSKCYFSTRLIDIQTSKILLAKEVNGNIENWLLLKSQLAEGIAQQLNNPITIDPSYKNQPTTLVTINQYAKVLTAIDQGEFDKAEQLRNVFEETNPSFKYYKDMKDDINQLKKQVTKNTADIAVLNKSGGRVVNAKTLSEVMMNITNPLSNYSERKEMMTEILKKNYQEIIEVVEFTNICNLPGGLELLMSFDKKEGKPTSKTIELYSNDLDYIGSKFENKEINPNTFSSYAFFYLRRFANIKNTINDKSLILKAIKLCDDLKSYNLKNQIEPYDINNFGGKSMFWLSFKNDLDLTIDHLVELLN